MATRLSRSLSQVNRRVLAGLASRAIPRVTNTSARAGCLAHCNTWSLAPSACRIRQVNIARYSHTDSGSSINPNASIPDVTAYKGSSVTEKHWMNQDPSIGTTLLVTGCYLANQLSGHLD